MSKKDHARSNTQDHPEFYDLFYSNRNPIEVDLLTTILRAAASLTVAANDLDPPLSEPSHYTPQIAANQAATADLRELRRLVEQIRQLAANDSRLATQLNALPDAFGDGSVLRTLFVNLFPDQGIRAVPDQKGNAVLSQRQIDILRMAAEGKSQQEIADHYGIAKSTVHTHLNNIYRTLDVHKPLDGLKRAAAMGCIGWDTVEDLVVPIRHETHGLDPFQDFCSTVGDVEPPLNLDELRPLAAFGLLLLAISGAAARQRHGDTRCNPTPRGVVYRLNRRGEITHRFGQDIMRTARSIAIAPTNAAAHGFTTGNLFVAHDQIPQHGLNRGAVSEFTPNGEYLRTFCGGDALDTRLIGMSICFGADGRLLATSGWLTNAILAFTAGGDMVERFTDDNFVHLCPGRLGLYGTQIHGKQSVIRMLDHSGQSVGVLSAAPSDARYLGIAVSESEHIYVVARERTRDRIDEIDENGNRIQTLMLPAGRMGKPAVDVPGRLIVPYDKPGQVLIVAPNGTLQSIVPLGSGERALAATSADNGDIYVGCGAP